MAARSASRRAHPGAVTKKCGAENSGSRRGRTGACLARQPHQEQWPGWNNRDKGVTPTPHQTPQMGPSEGPTANPRDQGAKMSWTDATKVRQLGADPSRRPDNDPSGASAQGAEGPCQPCRKETKPCCGRGATPPLSRTDQDLVDAAVVEEVRSAEGGEELQSVGGRKGGGGWPGM